MRDSFIDTHTHTPEGFISECRNRVIHLMCLWHYKALRPLRSAENLQHEQMICVIKNALLNLKCALHGHYYPSNETLVST